MLAVSPNPFVNSANCKLTRHQMWGYVAKELFSCTYAGSVTDKPLPNVSDTANLIEAHEMHSCHCSQTIPHSSFVYKCGGCCHRWRKWNELPTDSATGLHIPSFFCASCAALMEKDLHCALKRCCMIEECPTKLKPCLCHVEVGGTYVYRNRVCIACYNRSMSIRVRGATDNEVLRDADKELLADVAKTFASKDLVNVAPIKKIGELHTHPLVAFFGLLLGQDETLNPTNNYEGHIAIVAKVIYKACKDYGSHVYAG